MKQQHQINAVSLNRFFCCAWHRARAVQYAVENMAIGNASLSFRRKPESSGFNGTPGLSDGHASAQLSTFTISVIDTSQSLGITLSWSKPINREDSAALAMSEISGYRIYFGTKPSNLKILAVMTDKSTTQHTTTPLGANTYYFVATTYDIAKTESAFSNIESKPYRRRRLITIQS